MENRIRAQINLASQTSNEGIPESPSTDGTYKLQSVVSDGDPEVSWVADQSLPTIVNNRYLHTNASTGALEWSEVQSGATWGSITGTLSNQTDLMNTLQYKESSLNKVGKITSTSTDAQYPSAKCVYALIGNIESTLNAIRGVS